MKFFLQYFSPLLFSAVLSAQQFTAVYKNDYEDPLTNTKAFSTSYSNMYYDKGDEVFELLQEGQHFFNTEYAVIDETKEFIIETEIQPDFSKYKTGKAGLVWGYENSRSTNVLIINESNQFSIYYNEKGSTHSVQAFNSTGLTLMELSSKIKIKIHQKDGFTNFFLNDKKVFSCKALKLFGHRIGYAVGTHMRCSYLTVKQEREKLAVAAEAKRYLQKEQVATAAAEENDEVNAFVNESNSEIFISSLKKERNVDNEKGRNFFKADLAAGKNPLFSPVSIPLPDHKIVYAVLPSDQNTIIFSAHPKGQDSLRYVFYEMKRDGNNFETPIKIYECAGTDFSFGKATISSDKKVIIFSGSKLNYAPQHSDLFFTKKINDSTWSYPASLGSAVNSFGDEVTPFLFYDDKTLYFSSNAHPGFGSMDVFVTHRLDDTWTNWSQPENLGAVVNSRAYDAHFFIPKNGPLAWMSSTHSFYNNLDLFKLKLNPLKQWSVLGKTVNAKSGASIADVKVRLFNAKTKKAIDSAATDKNGKYILNKLKPGEYILDAEYGISHSTLNFKVCENQSQYTFDLALSEPEEGSSITLKNISFEANKFDILPESFSELDRLSKFLKENKQMKIEIHGHTSRNNEGEKFNIDLSGKRAAAVKSYLVSKGIAADRIQSKGFGFNETIYEGDDPAKQAVNRRVEIFFLK